MTKPMPLVSIIMPAYNCEAFIRKAVDSILTQSYQNFELLVGDDASNDQTRVIIQTYSDKRIVPIFSDTNLGVVGMYNLLFSKCKGNYITIQDADDWAHPDRIKRLLEVFDHNTGLDACASNGYICYGDDYKPVPAPLSHLLDKNSNAIPFFPASIMIKREVYEAVGGYHPFFDRLSSMDLYWICLIREKFSIYFLNELLYYARVTPNSNHRSFTSMRKLTSFDVYLLLSEQRLKSGTDWLEQNELEKIYAYEKSLSLNKDWLSRKFREIAVAQADNGSVNMALKFIIKAIVYRPRGLNNYRTLFYSLRRILKLS